MAETENAFWSSCSPVYGIHTTNTNGMMRRSYDSIAFAAGCVRNATKKCYKKRIVLFVLLIHAQGISVPRIQAASLWIDLNQFKRSCFLCCSCFGEKKSYNTNIHKHTSQVSTLWIYGIFCLGAVSHYEVKKKVSRNNEYFMCAEMTLGIQA